MTAVNEYEQGRKLGTLQDVIVDDAGQLLLLALSALGIAVAGQIDQIPVFVDKEVVNEERLTWCGRCHGQTLAAGQHVDEAGLAHVGAAYERVFGHGVLRTFAHVRVADYEFGALYLHLYGFYVCKSTKFWLNPLNLQSIEPYYE